jgi:hypothetical protein
VGMYFFNEFSVGLVRGIVSTNATEEIVIPQKALSNEDIFLWNVVDICFNMDCFIDSKKIPVHALHHSMRY